MGVTYLTTLPAVPYTKAKIPAADQSQTAQQSTKIVVTITKITGESTTKSAHLYLLRMQFTNSSCERSYNIVSTIMHTIATTHISMKRANHEQLISTTLKLGLNNHAQYTKFDKIHKHAMDHISMNYANHEQLGKEIFATIFVITNTTEKNLT
jgi:hypothetical protein